jgi:hypothetical protein
MAYRIWHVDADKTRRVIGWTESKRDALATCRTIPDAEWEDTSDED